MENIIKSKMDLWFNIANHSNNLFLFISIKDLYELYDKQNNLIIYSFCIYLFYLRTFVFS